MPGFDFKSRILDLAYLYEFCSAPSPGSLSVQVEFWKSLGTARQNRSVASAACRGCRGAQMLHQGDCRGSWGSYRCSNEPACAQLLHATTLSGRDEV